MKDITHAYDITAVEYRKRYDAIPPRTEDIDLAFSFIENITNPKVMEIGCAYGREAQYILTKTNDYLGIDISQKYIDMAQAEVSKGTFQCADVLEVACPNQLDTVFAFASLLHLSKDEVKKVLVKVHSSLASGGIIFLSLKRRDSYTTEIVTDQYCARRFYYYNRDIIRKLSGELYSEVFYAEQMLKEPWFTIVLKKNNV